MKATLSAVVTVAMVSVASAVPKGAGLTGPNGEPYVPGKWFDRFFMLVGENMDIWEVESQSTFSNLWKDAPNGRILANYYGITHPSQVSRLNSNRWYTIDS